MESVYVEPKEYFTKSMLEILEEGKKEEEKEKAEAAKKQRSGKSEN